MPEDNLNYKQAGSVFFFTVCEEAYADKNFEFVNNILKYIDVKNTNTQWLRTLLTCAWWPEHEGIILSHRQEFFNKCMLRYIEEYGQEKAEEYIRRFEPGHK